MPRRVGKFLDMKQGMNEWMGGWRFVAAGRETCSGSKVMWRMNMDMDLAVIVGKEGKKKLARSSRGGGESEELTDMMRCIANK